MWSPVRKALGSTIEGYRGEWHAFRQYAGNVTGPAAERLIVWFEPDLLPGYAWSFPLPGNRANIGFGVLRDGGRRVQTWRDLWPTCCPARTSSRRSGPITSSRVAHGVADSGPRRRDRARHRPRDVRRRRGGGHRRDDR